jgi:polysaccharide export outer membrane protein
MRPRTIALLSIVALSVSVASAAAQQPAAAPKVAAPKAASSGAAAADLPRGYVIGPADVLSVVVWRDKDMSADVVVRPDGRISLPLINEILAAGLTPEELRVKLVEAAGKFVEDPDVFIVVKEIRSRNVYIMGNVARPATYPLNGDMTVLQLIAVAGGLLEYADSKNITILRTEDGRSQKHKFNYKDVVSQKRSTDNLTLKPGDTVVVP